MTPYIFPGINKRHQGKYRSYLMRTPEEIIDIVCEEFGVYKELIFEPCRKRIYVDPRRCAMFIMRERLVYPFKKIGKLFNRDHATAMHSYRTAKELIETDKEFRDTYDRIINRL